VSAPAEAWPRTLERWLKFTAVGGMGIAVQLVVLAGLKNGFGLNYLLATAVAVEAAVLHNFLWHQRFTWRDRRTGKSLGRLLKFNVTAGTFSILGNLALMKLLIELAHFEYLPANGIAIAACCMANFLLSDRFVFEDGGRPSGEPGEFGGVQSLWPWASRSSDQRSSGFCAKG
jgi:putative flippase GtrA